MNEKTKESYWTFRNLRKQVWVWLLMIPLGLVIYHQDAIRGQWKFERLCKEDGGPRFYGKIEKGQGWATENPDEFEYQIPFGFGDVAFVRYTNKKGERFDVTKIRETREKREEYIFSPVDESKAVRYKLVHESPKRMSDDKRFGRSYLAVIDLADGRALGTYTRYSYRWTDPGRVILNAPTGVSCPVGGDAYRELVLKMGGWE